MMQLLNKAMQSQALIRPVTCVSRIQNWVGYVFFLQKVCTRYVLIIKLGMYFVGNSMFQTLFTLNICQKIWVLGQLLNTSITCKIKVKVDIKMIPR